MLKLLLSGRLLQPKGFCMKKAALVVGRRNFTRATASEDNIVTCDQIVDIPPKDVNLFSFITEKFDIYGDKPALISDVTGESISYKALKTSLKIFGSSLVKHGFSSGDVMAVFASNCPEYIYPLCCPSAVGGIITTLNPAYKANEVILQLKASGASMLFANASNASFAMECAKGAGIKKVIINDLRGSPDIDGIIRLSEMLTDQGDAFPINISPVTSDNDVVLLPYSSGTTGLPKGVMLTHHAIATNVIQAESFVPDPMNHLAYLPYYHMYALGCGLFGNLRYGRTIVTQDGFEPERFLSAIQNYKIEDIDFVPPIMVFLLKHPLVEKYDLSSIRSCTIGAAPCGPDMYNQFLEKFPHIEYMLQGYGMTETSPVASIQTFGNVKMGSIGIPVPATEMKVADLETGQSLPANETGEICIRGPQLMKGYLNNEEATKSTLIGDWLHSGDIGYFDEDGHFFIVDRLKELIKYKAYQVAPAELEDLLVAHPLINDAAVVGIPDEAAGELPKAFIVKSPDAQLTEEEVSAYVEEKVSSHKKLRGGVTFIDVIPKSPSGKILRRVLKDI